MLFSEAYCCLFEGLWRTLRSEWKKRSSKVNSLRAECCQSDHFKSRCRAGRIALNHSGGKSHPCFLQWMELCSVGPKTPRSQRHKQKRGETLDTPESREGMWKSLIAWAVVTHKRTGNSSIQFPVAPNIGFESSLIRFKAINGWLNEWACCFKRLHSSLMLIVSVVFVSCSSSRRRRKMLYISRRKSQILFKWKPTSFLL